VVAVFWASLIRIIPCGYRAARLYDIVVVCNAWVAPRGDRERQISVTQHPVENDRPNSPSELSGWFRRVIAFYKFYSVGLRTVHVPSRPL